MAVETIPRVRLPFPHPGQQAILASPARFKWVSAGRRWRKTTLALHPVVESCLVGKEIIWGAPTYDQCRTGWEELQHAARGVASFNETRMEAVFPSGGRTLFRSLDDPDNVRSKTADGFVMDEAAHCKQGLAAWHEVVRPILSDTGGWALFLSTPNGRNWFWQEWTAARQRPDSAAWMVPTLGVAIVDGRLVRHPHPLENPVFPFAELEKAYATQPERVFRQEFLGEFTEDGGGVFRRVREMAVARPQDKAVPGHQYVIGCDWGKESDFSVFAIVDLSLRACVAYDRVNEIDYFAQVPRLQGLVARFSPAQIIAEGNVMGAPLVEHLQRLGLPVIRWMPTNESKRTAVEALQLAFERGDITVIPDEILLAELEAYQAEKLPSGLLRYGAPGGMHDDCVTALMLAWQAAQVTPPTFKKARPYRPESSTTGY